MIDPKIIDSITFGDRSARPNAPAGERGNQPNQPGARPNRQFGGGMMFGGFRGNRPSARFFFMPAESVSTGNTWQYLKNDTVFDEAKNAMVTSTKITYKLVQKEVKNGIECLKITYKGTRNVLGKSVRMGSESSQDSRTDLKGTIWFDHQRGIILGEEFDENGQSTITTTGERAMTIPSTDFRKGKYYLVE